MRAFECVHCVELQGLEEPKQKWKRLGGRFAHASSSSEKRKGFDFRVVFVFCDCCIQFSVFVATIFNFLFGSCRSYEVLVLIRMEHSKTFKAKNMYNIDYLDHLARNDLNSL